jgi:hypothetical protein
MTKDQANEIRLQCSQLEQATAMGDEGAATRARDAINALLDELTEPATTQS